MPKRRRNENRASGELLRSRSSSGESRQAHDAQRRKHRSKKSKRSTRSRSRVERDGSQQRRSISSRRSRRHRSPTSSSSEVESRSRRESRYAESQNNFFDKFIDVIKDFKGINSSERDKIPVLNNVLPDFDPLCKEQSIDTWINKIEECAEIYSWDDKHTIHYALQKLTGVAKTWYQGLPTLLYSWAEWKIKLRESFPSRDNYAELLTEMLNKRVKFGDSLELYYYAKMNLLNRCEISGKRAVDCLLFGIEDRGVRLGAQSAGFTEPEHVLRFLKTIKVGQDRTPTDNNVNKDRRNKPTATGSNDTQSNNTSRKDNKFENVTCFNCNEKGHTFYRCLKPKLRCSNCRLMGHLTDSCPKANQSKSEATNVTKNVLQVETFGNTNSKYKMPVKINNEIVNGYVDLGSEGTLIRHSDAQRLKLDWAPAVGPMLKGFGGTPYCPIGLALCTLEIQGLQEKDVELLIVDDYLLNAPVLVGHTFTERPSVKIEKTNTDVIFKRNKETESVKYPLFCSADTIVNSNEIKTIPVKSNEEYTGCVYVQGSLRGREGEEYYLLPGEYNLNKGLGFVLIQNVCSKNLKFNTQDLITRSLVVNKTLRVNIVEQNDERGLDESSLKCGEGLTSQQKDILKSVIDKYPTCFSFGLHDLGYAKETEMVIQLTDSEPVVYRPYRLSFSEKQLVREMVKEMLDSGIVRESNSPYTSPIVLVNKKSGDKRLCVDYRALNRRTKREHYPLPRIEDQLDLLTDSSIFITLDLASGYYQIPIAEQSRDKTAFVTPDGQYEYCRMPFGLVNAPSVFQRTMNKVIQNSPVRSYVLLYMDDILIPASSFEQSMSRLEEVLAVLRDNGLTLKLSKCNFCFERIDYLGYEVSAKGIRPGSLKTEAISKFPAPRNVHEIRRFLGLASFFRRFVKGFALIARPLTNLLRKDVPWKWGEEESNAFKTLQSCLVERPVLAIYNPKAETQLHTDASKSGVAGILLQKDESTLLKPIAYYSRQTTTDEQKMHSFELETLAVIASLCKFRVYLLGIKFKIVTDCNALRTTLTKRDMIPRIARWWIQFLEYDCEIEYRCGEKMAHVDALSRAAIENDETEQHVLDILNINNNNDWLITVQQSDDEVKRIASILNDPKTKETTEIFLNYTLKNGRVYRVIDENTERWVVPKGARWQILKSNHDDVGHFGFDKTLSRIRSTYWFPKMRRFVKKYVSACLGCAHHKVPSGTLAVELHPIPKINIPFHTIHADHLGPFIRTKRGNMYILVIVDAFTKFVNITAVRNTKSSTSIRVFREHISYFGAPTRLITDQGTSFTSSAFKAYIESTGIKHVYNAVATPRANGQVERYNRTILAALGAMNHDKSNGIWDEHLPQIQLGINTTLHATTQKTPTELLFGRTATNPSEGILNDVINDIASDNSQNLENVRATASERISIQQNKDKERASKRKIRKVQFSEGDLVRVIRASTGIEGQSKKLEPKCQGPYRIKKILPNDRFVIEDTPITRKGKRYEAVVAIDKIFPWLVFQKPSSSESDVSDAMESNSDNND